MEMFHDLRKRSFATWTLGIATAITGAFVAARAATADQRSGAGSVVVDGLLGQTHRGNTSPTDRIRYPATAVDKPDRHAAADRGRSLFAATPEPPATQPGRPPSWVDEGLPPDASSRPTRLGLPTAPSSENQDDKLPLSGNRPTRLGLATARDPDLPLLTVAAVTLHSPQALAQPTTIVQRQDRPQQPPLANTSGDWWHPQVAQSILDKPRWVTFDLEQILLDTLRNSPRIQSVSSRTSVAIEAIVQQDAAFDSTVLFDAGYGRVNDPVGNTLTTGGPSRLKDDTLDSQIGVRRLTRRGASIDLSQQLGLKNSNSNFFDPLDQGTTRLALSLTQPLLDRSGRAYNERLLTQARIDSRVSWQEMRMDVEQRIAEVIAAYWQLYELRCHLLQQTDLLRRAQQIRTLVEGRQRFDAGRVELAKVNQRVARRDDQLVQLEAEVRRAESRLAALVGAEALFTPLGDLELIPGETPQFLPVVIDLRDAVRKGIEHRPEIRAATHELESAALSVRVTRTELVPQLNAVVDAYLAGLSGDFDVLRSLGDQFSRGGPGIAAGLEYEVPYGRRAARSRVRQAQHRFRQRSEELRETIQMTQAQVEIAVTSINEAIAAQATKQRLLDTASEEEQILTRRWRMMAADGNGVGVVLENLLDAQQRRTDAEREWTTAQTQYLNAFVELQRAMGTLLVRSGIQPIQLPCDNSVHFGHAAEALLPEPAAGSLSHKDDSSSPVPADAPGTEPNSNRD